MLSSHRGAEIKRPVLCIPPLDGGPAPQPFLGSDIFLRAKIFPLPTGPVGLGFLLEPYLLENLAYMVYVPEYPIESKLFLRVRNSRSGHRKV